MGYDCQNFKDGQVLTAECLNKMEQGILGAFAAVPPACENKDCSRVLSYSETGFKWIPIPKGAELDATLTQEGAAADAAAVGKAFSEAMQTVGDALANKQPKGNYVQTVNGQTPDESGNVAVASVQPTSIDLSQYESNGRIVETFADGTTKTTTVEFDGNGKPVKITDSAGNTTNLNW